ncbi:hypothetical protein [Sphingomonas jaspsi]|uniref:hypothetical protein n=1 Tax=Sphingomonas jaspsi TaxID=392409 RepID=UPI0004B12DA6|nr:hypothetical protein [Sphingomonas jaspsi]
MTNGSSCLIPRPSIRRLRVFAFDPQASTELDTAVINDAMVELPWEGDWEDPVTPGPVNEYVEVVDYDPTSRCFYCPLDLNDPNLLAQNGLPPSDGNPQFHQQMVFAVVMKTVRAFERALGRQIFWMREGAQAKVTSGTRREGDYPDFVRRLRIYPHAMREENAFYSPQKCALLFGYFRGAPARDGRGGGWVFTCLSQDIIAHETTHAILHGFWRRSVESTNVDSLAFHEGFADIVALLQHFSSRQVVEHELAKSGGTLRSVGLLTGLAQQFGRATGREGPLRFALKLLIDEEKALAENKPLDPDRHRDVTRPHQRGQILVAAVFDAFVTIFEKRTDDLFRIAGRVRGDGVVLSAELVTRLAEEAEKAADQVLRMCIRALDYLPPVDANFGEYLRAIITADTDLVANDRLHYRTAFAEAFSKRGIRVEGQSFSSTETLCWEPPEPFSGGRKDATKTAEASLFEILSHLQLSVSYGPQASDAAAHWIGGDMESGPDDLSGQHFFGGEAYQRAGAKRNLRDLAMMVVRANQAKMHSWLNADSPLDPDWERLLGIKFKFDPKMQTIRKDPRSDSLRFEVQSVRVSRRDSPDGETLYQLIVQVVQSRRGYLDPAVQAKADRGELDLNDEHNRRGDFTFRGGATLIVDLRDGRVTRVIRKRIDDERRLKQVRAFKLGDPNALRFDDTPRSAVAEPFAMLHRGDDR